MTNSGADTIFAAESRLHSEDAESDLFDEDVSEAEWVPRVHSGSFASDLRAKDALTESLRSLVTHMLQWGSARASVFAFHGHKELPAKDWFVETRHTIVDCTRFSAVSAAIGTAVSELSMQRVLSVLEARYDTRAALGAQLPTMLAVGHSWGHAIARHQIGESPESSAVSKADELLLELETGSADGDRIISLLADAERLQVDSIEVRQRLSDALYRTADLLLRRRLDREQQLLWSAIRSSTSFGTLEDLPRLHIFLEKSAPPSVRQVSLQAIANKCQIGPAPGIPDVYVLRDRVVKLAEELSNDNLLAFPEVAALALSAIAAAAALAHPHIDALVARLGAFPLLARQLRRQLGELIAKWDSAEHSEPKGFVLKAIGVQASGK